MILCIIIMTHIDKESPLWTELQCSESDLLEEILSLAGTVRDPERAETLF